MSNQWAAPTYTDGDLTVAKACGLPVFQSPLPNDTGEYVFTQPFMQFRANVSALAIGDPHPSSGMTPDYSAWTLIAEGEKQDMGNGLVRWNRTYAKRPSSWDDFSDTIAYSFIGAAPLGPLSAAQVGRLRKVRQVQCRVHYDYFKLGTSGVTDPITGAAGLTITTPGDIPILSEFRYVSQYYSGSQYGGWYYDTDYIADSSQDTSAGFLLPSVPTQTQYLAMIKDARVNGWGAGVSFQKIDTSVSPPVVDLASLAYYGSGSASYSHTSLFGQIVARDSNVSRWQKTGDIYQRTTIYVLAQ